MIFANPTYLWTFLGLLVPLAIHFWNKKKVKTIKISSTQLLQESNPKQTRELQLNELLLLFLRLILLSILTLILAGAQLSTNPGNAKITYLVEPSLLKSERITSLLDTVSLGEIKILQKGFPPYEKDQEMVDEVPNYWELVKEFHQLHTDSIVVLTEGFASGIQGKRPKTDHPIRWIQFNSADQKHEAYILARKIENQIEITKLQSDFERLDFEKEKFPLETTEILFNKNRDSLSLNGKWLPVDDQGPIVVFVVPEEEIQNEKIYLQAAFSALERVLERKFVVTEESFTEEASPDLWVWLSKTIPPRTDQKMLVFKPDSLANGLIEKVAGSKLFYLTQKLNSENVFTDHLVERLVHMLDLNADLEKEIKEHDRRTMGLDQLEPEVLTAGIPSGEPQTVDLSKRLWGLLFLLFILERTISWYRKQ